MLTYFRAPVRLFYRGVWPEGKREQVIVVSGGQTSHFRYGYCYRNVAVYSLGNILLCGTLYWSLTEVTQEEP